MDKNNPKNNNPGTNNDSSDKYRPKVYFEDEIIDDENPAERPGDNPENAELKFGESGEDIPVDKKTAVSKRGQIGEWPFLVEEHEEDMPADFETEDDEEIEKSENFSNIQLDDRKVLPHQPSNFQPDGVFEPEQEPPLPLSEKEKNSPHIPPAMLFPGNNMPPTDFGKAEPLNIDDSPFGSAARLSFLAQAGRLRLLDQESQQDKLSSLFKKILMLAEKKQRITINDLVKNFNLDYYQADKHLSILLEKGLLEKFDTDAKNSYYKPIYN